MLRESYLAVSCSLDASDRHRSSVAPAELAVIKSLDESDWIGDRPTVLIIDDDNDSLVLLENILDQFTCNIVCQSSGQAALAYALQSPPDLILLDIWMPDIDGLEIARTLQQSSATRGIPIAAVTALASQRDRELILRAGCTHYISKPFLLEDMEAVLRQYLHLQDE